MPGQSALTPDERRVFLRGQMVDTADGPIFLHGDVMVNNKNQVQFLPGQLVYNEERDKEEFIPGITGETATGSEKLVKILNSVLRNEINNLFYPPLFTLLDCKGL